MKTMVNEDGKKIPILTVKRCENYMRIWMQLQAIVKIDEDEEYYYFQAKKYLANLPNHYKVEKRLDSFKQGNVWCAERLSDGKLDEWEMIDSINAEG